MDVKSQERFRHNLRNAMALRGLSQRAFAEKIETGYTHLNCVLTGKADPSLTFCERVANALNVDIVELLTDPEKKSKKTPKSA